MRIAIVDDSQSERSELKGRLTKHFLNNNTALDIFEFSSGSEFLASAKKEKFTLVFLDIYMGEENGVDTAKALRDFDKDCILVFTTCSTEHAIDGFKVRALHYLVKPYSDDELKALLGEIFEKLPAPDKYLDIKIVGGNVRVRFNEIIYAEHYQHRIQIYTSSGQTVSTRQTFSEFNSRLNDERFFLCSRGVLINLEYALDFDGTAFTLTNGHKISVSRDNSKQARLTFGDFLFNRRKSL